MTGPVATRHPYADFLADIEKPARYVGGEYHEVRKDPAAVLARVCLGFPDVYDIGMSHLGTKILYSLLNKDPRIACERAFAPWTDMEAELRARGVPLVSLESQTPLSGFDVVGISIQYEMTFTNVLEMLDLAGIPLRSAARGAGDPLVVVGGPVVFNLEPLADFVDLAFIGDGEEMIPEFLDLLKGLKGRGAARDEILRAAAQIEGVYAPSLYPVERDERTGLLIAQPGSVS